MSSMGEFVSSIEPTPENSGQKPTRTTHPRGGSRVLRNIALLVGSLALAACAAPSPVGVSNEPLKQEPIRSQQTVATPTPEPDSESLVLPGTVNNPLFVEDCPVEVIAPVDGIVSVELQRSNAASDDRVYGPGFRVLNKNATGFLFFKVGESYPEQGFDVVSGGFGPGDELEFRIYINRRYLNGNHTGVYMLEFSTQAGHVVCRENPTLQYLILFSNGQKN